MSLDGLKYNSSHSTSITNNERPDCLNNLFIFSKGSGILTHSVIPKSGPSNQAETFAKTLFRPPLKRVMAIGFDSLEMVACLSLLAPLHHTTPVNDCLSSGGYLYSTPCFEAVRESLSSAVLEFQMKRDGMRCGSA
ncbi:uncharacterized protein H6S33_003524 [Morchella sextelata]|uniref:uncharacterized protein n=1 Tax=Morchella sextelata TaxID=1174677 RepID=UPI001D039708|nr:uncharacterized protein H6S33_003524 [Morchella sextelata]KAH0606690.1 hypothetical protein H6S33_003524 [Morchella sextelata]